MSTEVSLTIIAMSLLFLVIFAIIAAIYLIQLLIVLKKTTLAVEEKVNPLFEKAKDIMHITKATTECIRSNVALTTPLFHSVGKISGLTANFPGKFKSNTHDNTLNINLETKHGKIDFGDWAEWVASGIILIQRLRNK